MTRFLTILTAMAVLLPAGLPSRAADEAKPAAPAAAATEAQVEGLLFFASNDDKAPADARVSLDAAVLANTTGRLAKTFKGFAHFHLIGRHTQSVFKEYESWVVPSQNLCLKMDSRGPADGGGINLHLQLWQDKKVLVKSDTVIRKDRPVFLGGPAWRGGRLIFVVILK